MKIETGSRLVTLTVAVLSAFSVATLVLAERSVEERRRAQQTQLETTQALSQLARHGDELTNAARYYAASGEERYRARFYAEIEFAGRDAAVARLRALLGDDADEMALIRNAKENSDALVAFERKAVELAEGGARAAAVERLLSAEFRARQVVVTGPLELATSQLETRQSAQIARLSARATTAATVAWATMALNVVAMLAVLLGFYRRRVIRPLARITRQVKLLVAGKHNVRFVGPHDVGQAVEIDELARTLDNYQKLALELDRQREELRLANAEQHAIADAATSGIAFIRDRTIERANPQLHAIFGWPPGGIVGQSTRIWASDEVQWAAQEDLLYAPVWRGETSTHELQLARRDGSRVWTRISGRAVDLADPARGSVWIVDDITREHEAIEEMRRARALAEDAARMKSDFLANMSHEIRTPMNAIVGMAYLALKSSPTPRLRDYLKKIQTSAQMLLGIINDILDLSKIDAGKLIVERAEFDLEQVLDSVTNLIGEKAAAKGLELIIDVDREVPTDLLGDSLRLGQVLINYANNAVKFTEHGEIEISVRVAQQIGDEVLLRFAVRDTGIGLSAEQCGRLFRNFEQADSSTTRKYGGTGLGLVIAKQLAGLMGGEVGVDSEIGRGSTFWFTARVGRGPARAARPQPAPELRGRRILVADDSGTAREVICEMLGSMGFAVKAVASGTQAVAEIVRAVQAGEAYEIVFIDWQMPELDGIATAREVRRLGLQAPPTLVMISAYGRDELFRSAEAAGIADVLIKPLTASLLYDTVTRALGAALDEAPAPAVATTPLEARLSTIFGAHILLVEDNDINQDVAIEILKGAGFVVDLAENGLVALERVRENPYDAVLMDVQMPVMDGLTATREIRAIESLRALPIIAMTANAMQGDREACLAAGMQDHVAKPIDPDDLWRALLKWIVPGRTPAGAPAVAAAEAAADAQASPPADDEVLPGNVAGVDLALGLRHAAGRKALYVALLRKFVAGQADAVQAIECALAAGDTAGAQRLAHTLKGTAATIGAVALAQTAGGLEAALGGTAARASDERIDALLSELAPALAQVVAALRAAVPAPAACGGAEAIDTARLKAVVARLTARLADNDAEANDLFAQNAGLLRSALGERYAQLEQALDAYDFDRALGVLEAALTTFGRPA